MFGFGSSAPVAEHEASGEIERVYHEIRQVLRVSGVNLNFRTWASYDQLLPVLWDAIQPNAETRAFEHAADQLRADAARASEQFAALGCLPQAGLGESQQYQLHAALQLYHYINPKLLLLTSAIRLALTGEFSGGNGDASQRFRRGIPANMYPLEMENESPDDPQLQAIFTDIQQTLSLPSINSDYRTMALWPPYLQAVWNALKPRIGQTEYQPACNQLRQRSRMLAQQLPLPIELPRERLAAVGADHQQAIESCEVFETLLPGLILNVSMCLRDWHDSSELARSPFPAESVVASQTNNTKDSE